MPYYIGASSQSFQCAILFTITIYTYYQNLLIYSFMVFAGVLWSWFKCAFTVELLFNMFICSCHTDLIIMDCRAQGGQHYHLHQCLCSCPCHTPCH